MGVFPIWILGVIDYHGSRLVAFERISRGNAPHVTAVLERLFATVGPPERILTDRAPTFGTMAFQACLGGYNVRHVRTEPSHPWTNRRIERVFRTFNPVAYFDGRLSWYRFG